MKANDTKHTSSTAESSSPRRSILVLTAMSVLPLAAFLPAGELVQGFQEFAWDQVSTCRAALHAFYDVVTDPAAWLRTAGVESPPLRRPL